MNAYLPHQTTPLEVSETSPLWQNPEHLGKYINSKDYKYNMDTSY